MADESNEESPTPDFLKQDAPDLEAAHVLDQASADRAQQSRRPFSKPPKGASQAAIFLLVVFVVIWIAVKILG